MIKTVVQVEGMACSMCEAHVNDAVRRAFSVKKVTASHKKGICEIHSAQPLDEGKLRTAIGAGGYTVGAIVTESYEKKGFSLFGKK